MLSPTDNELDSDKYTTFPSLFIIKLVMMKFSKSATVTLQREIKSWRFSDATIYYGTMSSLKHWKELDGHIG